MLYIDPNNNVDAPINSGAAAQTKAGSLGILGNVGVGTYTPGASLDVYTSGGFAADLVHVTSGAQLLGLGSNSAGRFSTIRSYNNSVGPEPLILNDIGGYVGIGTTTPAQPLDVNGAIKGTQFCIGSACISAWGYTTLGPRYNSGSATCPSGAVMVGVVISNYAVGNLCGQNGCITSYNASATAYCRDIY